MTIINQLASVQGLKGNEANIGLARQISLTDDKNAVKELVGNLTNKNKNIQSDCIKTLYETGYLNPELIADYYSEFIKLLKNRNNRLVWGGMIALATITDLRHQEVFSSLPEIMEAVQKGSVITLDQGIEILAKLNKHENYSNTTEPLLIAQLWKCPIKQFPMYIEKTLPSVNKQNKGIYGAITGKRMIECENDSQRKRLEKSLKQIIAV